MSKLLLVLAVGVISVLIMTDVVEVSFHADKYKNIPALAGSLIKDKATIERGRAAVVGAKRRVELFMTQDKEKRLALALLYVKADAKRLKELTQGDLNVAVILPPARLLVASIDRVRSISEEAPADVVAKMKRNSEESFSLAREALSGLQSQHEQFEELYKDFSRLSATLDKLQVSAP